MFWKKKLKNFYTDDQRLRVMYMEVIHICNNDWQTARDFWISKGANPEDMFEDFSSGRQKKSKRIIKRHYRKILKNKEFTTWAWTLVQHSEDIKYQSWFLNKLDPNSEDYKLLYDRICINTDQPQKYNTQTLI